MKLKKYIYEEYEKQIDSEEYEKSKSGFIWSLIFVILAFFGSGLFWLMFFKMVSVIH